MLTSIEWPGNVRQLNNVIERLMVMCDNGIINSDMVNIGTDIIDETGYNEKEYPLTVESNGREYTTESSNKNITEKELIKKVLQEARGNRELAAKKLGISTTTLWRKIKSINSIDKHYLDLVKYGRI
jgi:DNA-binding NtrC family response regulator